MGHDLGGRALDHYVVRVEEVAEELRDVHFGGEPVVPIVVAGAAEAAKREQDKVEDGFRLSELFERDAQPPLSLAGRSCCWSDHQVDVLARSWCVSIRNVASVVAAPAARRACRGCNPFGFPSGP